MKFIVTRTSGYDETPCVGAIQEEHAWIDRRTAARPEDVPAHKGETDWWYGSGTNHRIEDGEIMRDCGPILDWVIDIPTMDDLLQFIADNGEVVIGQPLTARKPDLTRIEIYDSCRE